MTYFSKAAIENVKRRIISVVEHVIVIVLHLHSYRVPVVIFPAFEALVTVLFGDALQRPLLLRLPVLSQPGENHWDSGPFKISTEFLHGHRSSIHSETSCSPIFVPLNSPFDSVFQGRQTEVLCVSERLPSVLQQLRSRLFLCTRDTFVSSW